MGCRFGKVARRSAVAVVAILALAAPSRAGVCSLDDRPGATLLLPYFEVDLDRPTGRTTLFSVNNAASAAVLANVVVWTDLGVPTLSFPVFLTGYDVQTINLRDVFAGRLPRTASASQDPQDVISPQGDFSGDLSLSSCNGFLPPVDLTVAMREHLRAAHTGKSSPVWNACAGQFFADGLARGYVTVDTVRQCGILVPGDPGYFGSGGAVTHQNVLWGDFFFVEPGQAYAQGENLIRLQADPVALAGKRTFYGRYVNGSGTDGREPLPGVWAGRFVKAELFDGGTDLIAWRDSGRVVEPFPCGQWPSWYPLIPSRYLAFDEEENPFFPPQFPTLPPSQPPFDSLAAEANRFAVGSERQPDPYDFGWIYLDLGLFRNGAFDPSQGWLGIVMKAEGRFSVGVGATPLVSGCQSGDPSPPGF